RENFLSAIMRRQLGLLLLTLRSASFFHWRGSLQRIKSIAGKISGVATEIGAAGEDRDTVNRDQPNRERLESDARLTFFALDRGVHFLNVGSFAVIHSLASQR